jgi:hypothetical protein
LKRICSFPKWKPLPDESSFSPLSGFAEAKLTERVPKALIKEHLATVLTGYIDLNGSAVEVSEKPVKTALAHTPLLNWWNRLPEHKPVLSLTLCSSGQAELPHMVFTALSQLHSRLLLPEVAESHLLMQLPMYSLQITCSWTSVVVALYW